MFWWYHHLLECPAHCTGNLASRRICRVAALDSEDTFGGIDRQFTDNNLRGICSEKKIWAGSSCETSGQTLSVYQTNS
jgi:hypothetical protein